MRGCDNISLTNYCLFLRLSWNFFSVQKQLFTLDPVISAPRLSGGSVSGIFRPVMTSLPSRHTDTVDQSSRRLTTADHAAGYPLSADGSIQPHFLYSNSLLLKEIPLKRSSPTLTPFVEGLIFKQIHSGEICAK